MQKRSGYSRGEAFLTWIMQDHLPVPPGTLPGAEVQTGPCVCHAVGTTGTTPNRAQPLHVPDFTVIAFLTIDTVRSSARRHLFDYGFPVSPFPGRDFYAGLYMPDKHRKTRLSDQSLRRVIITSKTGKLSYFMGSFSTGRVASAERVSIGVP